MHLCTHFHAAIVSFVRFRIVSYQHRHSRGARAFWLTLIPIRHWLHSVLPNRTLRVTSFSLSLSTPFLDFLSLLLTPAACYLNHRLLFRCYYVNIPHIKTKFNFQIAIKEKRNRQCIENCNSTTIPLVESTCIPDL